MQCSWLTLCPCLSLVQSVVRTGNTVAIAIAFAEAIRIGNTTFTFAFAEVRCPADCLKLCAL